MGYTHYWTFKSSRGNSAKVEQTYIKAIAKCAKVVRAYSKQFGGISGYSAHSETYSGLTFNGSARVGQCEDFVCREHYNENESFNFCKTAQNPYDTVAVACLIVLKHYLGDLIEIKSDGRFEEWADGLTLARTVLGLKSLEIPSTIQKRESVA